MKRLVFATVAGFLLGLACQSVDPNKGTFSCEKAEDCGSGFECRPQFAGGGRCFAEGLCANDESCNGVDDNCDGRIDESFATMGEACDSGRKGVCSAGKKICTTGAITCEATAMPSTETCNRLDDDCNGMVDEAFDLTSDSQNCGECGRRCPTGTRCQSSSCIEARCDDGVDNDSNGVADCLDPVCFGFDCDSAVLPASRCGFAPIIPDAGALDAGDDGGVPDGGTADASIADGGVDAGADGGDVDGGFVRGCFRPEVACDDGFDNDGDGLADCADPDCDGRTCFTGQACTMRACPGPG